ncbi:Protein FAR1-RELATED SEQUENCE 5 [Acorus gramineus]|uniref:Protein FAR1-RELATED SEQUENCE 5 n=1 Tax=Acorus gramineus TaxID=55184 RepID=A0AAV9BIG4_ACOGR|nr:Protein FAR1-RELATED SEQUENCE 5 [Acorus gramineus]
MSGMEFDSIEEAFSRYKAFAFQCSFGVMRSGRRFTLDGDLKAIIFACSKEGKLRKKKDETTTITGVSQARYKPTCKTNCKARMQIRTFSDGKWVLDLLVLEHNHEVDPKLSRFHICHRALTAHVMKQLAINDAAGLPPCKTFDALAYEGGGYNNLPYTEQDCWNYLQKVRRLQLGEGYIEALLQYFSKQHELNACFFYRIDLDEEGKLKNVFWADARCRAAYQYFRNVVLFATTYLTNRYAMPFAPFIGVNHHGQ